MAARGRGLFSLYTYRENFKNLLVRNHWNRETFKNLLVRNHWTDFNITWQECFFGDPLPRLFKHYSSKNMTARRRGLFFLYIYMENINSLPVRNQWTDFNITWQECIFGTFYKVCSSCHDSSKTWPSGARTYFPYVSI